jgi:PadR family transcriptional regulator, regulatory protein PadR
LITERSVLQIAERSRRRASIAAAGDRACARDSMHKDRHDMIRGTLDLLILRVLSLEPMHGWGISERIQERSANELEVNQGALYPALHRLVRWGWITSEWRQTEHNRKARYYRLTSAGSRQLGEELAHWRRLSGAVERVIGEV